MKEHDNHVEHYVCVLLKYMKPVRSPTSFFIPARVSTMCVGVLDSLKIMRSTFS